MSRVGGWVAHVLEYQADNRLIRPRARYVGPDEQAFVRTDERLTSRNAPQAPESTRQAVESIIVETSS